MWVEGDANGWACSNCEWSFPVPTLLSGAEAKSAYDRLASVKFREHKCGPDTSSSAAKGESKPDSGTAFVERVRAFIKRGYSPKIAVDLVLHEMEFEEGSGSSAMEKARADAEDFLQRVRKGLI